MQKRLLGNTGIPVSVLSYGAMAMRDLDERQSARILNAALDQGITFIDTAPDYGMSEAFIGRAIAHRREEYFLTSKCGCNVDAAGKYFGEPRHIWTRAKLLGNIEHSLRLLQTDHLDLWQMHGPLPENLPGRGQHETIQTMLDLKRQGKVRAIGISFSSYGSTHPDYPAEAAYRWAGEMLDYGFETMQMVYGGLVRRCEGTIKHAAGQGLGVIARGVVRQFFPNHTETFQRAGLQELCSPGESMNQFLIRFSLNHSGIATALIGTGSLEHLQENIQAANRGPLPEDVYTEAKKRLDRAGLTAGGIAYQVICQPARSEGGCDGWEGKTSSFYKDRPGSRSCS